MFEKILVCLDGSPLAEQVLPYAAEKARAFNSKLILLQVITPHITIPPGAGYIVPPARAGGSGYPAAAGSKTMSYSEVELAEIEREDGEATDYMEGLAAGLRERGIDVETATVHGKPGEAIVGFARDHDVKLIAIATHGRSGLGRAIFGSVADYVLKETFVPLLVIRPEEAAGGA